MNLEPNFTIPDNSAFHQIVVPTVDTVRTSYLLDILMSQHKHVLLTGPTGTGKSLAATNKLLRGLDRKSYVSLLFAFSARTTASQTQDFIDNKLERRRAGVLGPPPNKRAVIFIDDLNMPSRVLECQPPIELLRQWMDYGGWYDRKSNTFRQIVDVQFVAAMGPTGGGRNPITQRYTRHYNTLCLNPYDEASLKRIFTTITKWWLDPFPVKVRSLTRALVDATVSAYTTITHQLLPTPTKSHYTFNLRDISKVFQGIMLVDSEYLKEPVDLVRLWSHECSRVFGDRLIDQQDMEWFDQLITQQVVTTFKMPMQEFDGIPPSDDGSIPALATGRRRQIFCDFSNPRAKKYVEVRDFSALSAVVDQALLEYNTMEKNQMNLVMFLSALDHVARISRILRQPYGNALLVGVGGSGRQSLTRLAAFLADYEVYQIEITKQYDHAKWREDLREVYKRAGMLNKPIVFLLADSQIRQESWIEDINSMLNSGEIPSLFANEDYVPIIEQTFADARKAGRAESNAAVFAYFIERCRTNIHVVLSFSPVPDSFRNRLRMYPSLVNCTTIDWFHSWSSDALKQVATHFLKDVDLEPDVKNGVVDVCVDMQERVIELSKSYLSSLRRFNYVTPTSYLELIKLFRNLFESSRSTIRSAQSRYQTGLQKLEDTEIQVKAMQIQLEALRPELIQSSKDTVDLIKTIEQRSLQVAATSKIVAAEEKECNEQADSAGKIKAECEQGLQEAMPALKQALEALRVLKKSALDELRTMKVPTQGVILTIEALCIMMGVEPKKVGPVGNRYNDYWDVAKKKVLNDPQLFVKLLKYNKDDIPEAIIAKVRPYCRNPDFSPSKVAQASKAAEGFCKWVLAMEVYDRVAAGVKPKRDALALAEKTLETAQEQLQAKKIN